MAAQTNRKLTATVGIESSAWVTSTGSPRPRNDPASITRRLCAMNMMTLATANRASASREKSLDQVEG